MVQQGACWCGNGSDLAWHGMCLAWPLMPFRPPPPLSLPQCHVKNLKPSPAANPLVNRCIECGFCESNCPSRWAREGAVSGILLGAYAERAHAALERWRIPQLLPIMLD